MIIFDIQQNVESNTEFQVLAHQQVRIMLTFCYTFSLWNKTMIEFKNINNTCISKTKDFQNTIKPEKKATETCIRIPKMALKASKVAWKFSFDNKVTGEGGGLVKGINQVASGCKAWTALWSAASRRPPAPPGCKGMARASSARCLTGQQTKTLLESRSPTDTQRLEDCYRWWLFSLSLCPGYSDPWCSCHWHRHNALEIICTWSSFSWGREGWGVYLRKPEKGNIESELVIYSCQDWPSY